MSTHTTHRNMIEWSHILLLASWTLSYTTDRNTCMCHHISTHRNSRGRGIFRWFCPLLISPLLISPVDFAYSAVLAIGLDVLAIGGMYRRYWSFGGINRGDINRMAESTEMAISTEAVSTEWRNQQAKSTGEINRGEINRGQKQQNVPRPLLHAFL